MQSIANTIGVNMANPNIKNYKPTPAYVTWTDDKSMAAVFKSNSDVAEAYGLQHMSRASHRSFLDIDTNISVRTGYGRRDYDSFRPSEATPKQQRELIKQCMDAYKQVGIIRQVIDLMGDFGSKGIKLVHSSKNVQNFYQQWFKKVGGVERSERFLNMLYRCGNVVVKRRTAKLTQKTQRILKKTIAEADIVPEPVKVEGKEVGWKYDFFNPTRIEIIEEELSEFADEPLFGIKLHRNFRRISKHSSTNMKSLFAQLPKEIQVAVEKGSNIAILPPDKTNAYYYKKDDWQLWADPIIAAILDDVYMYEKMKLADLSALDGAISNVRLWTLGDLSEKIMPTKAAINKLRDILANNVGGGTIDLVWGPELKFTESNTQVYKFLGQEKYEPVLTSIYAGIGVPPTMTGSSSSSNGGMTNNFISLQTLIETLEYGRGILRTFWEKEIEIVQKAMGFRLPAHLHFDHAILTDKTAHQKLLMDLVDRNIMTEETMLERFGELFDIEQSRMKSQEKKRDSGDIPPKAGPFHNPQEEDEKKKLALNKDLINPEQIGLPPIPDDIKQRRERELKMQEKKFQPVNPNGRPKNKKDTKPRKKKRVLPRSKAVVSEDYTSCLMWIEKTQSTIADFLNPVMLKHYDKKNMRSLTKNQVLESEDIKFRVLANIEPFTDVNIQEVKGLMEKDELLLGDMSDNLDGFISDFVEAYGRAPTVTEMRNLKTYAYLESYKE